MDLHIHLSLSSLKALLFVMCVFSASSLKNSSTHTCLRHSLTSIQNFSPAIVKWQADFGALKTQKAGFTHLYSGREESSSKMKPKAYLGKIFKSIMGGKVRLFLSVCGLLCVVCEVLREALDKIPFLDDFFKFRSHHGIGFIAIAYIIQTLNEIVEKASESAEMLEKSKKNQEAREKTQGKFQTEQEAARAYDAATMSLYGRNALLNFPANKGRDPYNSGRVSEFFGVHWNPKAGAWEAAVELNED